MMKHPVAEIGDGYHYSLSEQEAQALRLLSDSTSIDQFLATSERDYLFNSPERIALSANTWEFIHRAFTDDAEYPLSLLTLGGEVLHPESDYILRLTTPAQVREVAAALQNIGQDDFHHLFILIPPDSYTPPLDEQDSEFTWNCFENIREVWILAAAQARYILFAAERYLPLPEPQKNATEPSKSHLADYELPNGVNATLWASSTNKAGEWTYFLAEFFSDQIPTVHYRTQRIGDAPTEWIAMRPFADISKTTGYEDEEPDSGAQLGGAAKLAVGTYILQAKVFLEDEIFWPGVTFTVDP